ncbi:conjugal transfer protein TraN [Vibrio sp. SCSIO 43140]|uniref:conjugal transfer protein TraN n=1 Tax=Vibrio sp. SCSIO 43140 TaxID=2819100 RepID=UPI002076274C|nr:conjugal transfer protein TraN [Vibrio sp. SCSIO 43140]USD58852.1 conjugal transfer protein TraN [Vibrio sp. SCSIO 43140]
MFKKILTHFSLLAFFTQLFHISYIGVLYAATAPVVYAQNMTLDEMFNGYNTPSMGGDNSNVGGVTFADGELFGRGYTDAKNEGHFDADQAYQNESRLRQSADGLSTRIGNNVVGNETDYDAAAYNTLKENYQNNFTKLESDDTIMTDADQILSDLADDLTDPDSDFFSECTTVTNTYTESREYIGKVQYECQEPDRTNLSSCEINRFVDYPILKTGGTGSIEFVDDYTFRLTIGNPGEALTGYCREYNRSVQIKLRDDLEIESARLLKAQFDDHIQVYLNDTEIMEFAWGRWNGGFPYTDLNPRPDGTWSGCEKSTIWQICDGCRHGSFPNGGDVTALFNEARSTGNGFINFRNRVAAHDIGYSYSQIEIKTRTRAAPKEYIEQKPAGCATHLGYEQPRSTCDTYGTPGTPNFIDPQCDADYTFGGNGTQSAMCTFDGWRCVEYQDSPPTYQHAVSSLPITLGGVTSNGKECSKVNAENYECNPLPGQEICGMLNWPESQERTCGTFAEMNDRIPDRCAPYRESGDCSLISSSPSFQDPVTGRSYVTNSVYECNTYTDASYEYTVEEETCSGEMKCVAGDCDYSTLESNGDFGEAMAVFKMLEDFKQNMECDNPDDISTCKVFNGEASYCGVEKTGLGFNCCSLTAGQVNKFDYIKGIMDQYSMENAIQQIAMAAEGGFTYGSWATHFPTPVNDTVSYVTDAVSSGWDAIVRNVTGETVEGVATEATSEAVFSGIQQQIMQQIQNILPDALNKILFTETTTSTGATVITMNPAITGAMSTIMALYAAYQLVKLAAMMVSECDDKESGMGIKLDMGQCIYSNTSCHVDTLFGCWIERRHYCCYPSPLGRIIMEQAAPILGISLDPRNGNCSGMTFDQISTLDWENDIDLSEWEALIMASGLPVTHNELDIDTLSSQPWMPNNDHALNPVDLNKERFDSTNASDTFKENHDSALPDNVDCSVYPRPPVCDSPLSILSPE